MRGNHRAGDQPGSLAAPLRARISGPPLALPGSARGLTLDALSQFEAVALFVERAAAIKRGSWNRLLRGTSGARDLVRHWARERTSWRPARTGTCGTDSSSAAAGFRGDGRAPHAGRRPVSARRDPG